MSKLLNIKIDEGATFTKALTFTRRVSQGSVTHPITGVVTNRFTRQALPLTGYTFRAQIKDRFDNPTFIETMEVRVLDSASGRIALTLSKTQTARLAQLNVRQPTGIQSQRTYRLGYFDVFATSSSGDSTKIFFGECFMTRSASRDPRNQVALDNAIQLSAITPIANDIVIDVDRTAGQNYVGIRYYLGGLQVSPIAGTVAIFRKPTTSNQFPASATATLQGNQSTDEALIRGNTTQFRASASNIVGADSYQIVVSSN